MNWNRKMKKEKWTHNNKLKKKGRPRKGMEIEEIILKLVMENARDTEEYREK